MSTGRKRKSSSSSSKAANSQASTEDVKLCPFCDQSVKFSSLATHIQPCYIVYCASQGVSPLCACDRCGGKHVHPIAESSESGSHQKRRRVTPKNSLNSPRNLLDLSDDCLRHIVLLCDNISGLTLTCRTFHDLIYQKRVPGLILKTGEPRGGSSGWHITQALRKQIKFTHWDGFQLEYHRICWEDLYNGTVEREYMEELARNRQVALESILEHDPNFSKFLAGLHSLDLKYEFNNTANELAGSIIERSTNLTSLCLSGGDPDEGEAGSLGFIVNPIKKGKLDAITHLHISEGFKISPKNAFVILSRLGHLDSLSLAVANKEEGSVEDEEDEDSEEERRPRRKRTSKKEEKAKKEEDVTSNYASSRFSNLQRLSLECSDYNLAAFIIVRSPSLTRLVLSTDSESDPGPSDYSFISSLDHLHHLELNGSYQLSSIEQLPPSVQSFRSNGESREFLKKLLSRKRISQLYFRKGAKEDSLLLLKDHGRRITVLHLEDLESRKNALVTDGVIKAIFSGCSDLRDFRIAVRDGKGELNGSLSLINNCKKMEKIFIRGILIDNSVAGSISSLKNLVTLNLALNEKKNMVEGYITVIQKCTILVSLTVFVDVGYRGAIKIAKSMKQLLTCQPRSPYLSIVAESDRSRKYLAQVQFYDDKVHDDDDGSNGNSDSSSNSD